MNVSLTPRLEEFVREKVESGLYNSASEVVREALRLLVEQEKIRQMKAEEVRAEIQKGLDQLDKGLAREIDFEAVKNRGRQKLAAVKNTNA